MDGVSTDVYVPPYAMPLCPLSESRNMGVWGVLPFPTVTATVTDRYVHTAGMWVVVEYRASCPSATVVGVLARGVAVAHTVVVGRFAAA